MLIYVRSLLAVFAVVALALVASVPVLAGSDVGSPGRGLTANQTVNPPGVTPGEIKTNAPFRSGLNSFVLLGGGSGAEIASAVAAVSGQTVNAIWTLKNGQWQVYIPSVPAGSTLQPITVDAAALFAILGELPPVIPTPAPSPTPAPQPVPAEGTVYTMRSGDTLSDIAVYYNSSSFELANLNGIVDRNFVPAGLRILVPGPASGLPTVPLSSLPTVRYTVQEGDSLLTLAHSFNTTVGLLERLNGLPPGSVLFARTTIRLPE